MIVYAINSRAAVGGLLLMTLAAAGGIHAAEAGGAAPLAEPVADPAAAQPLTREQIQSAMAAAQAQRETHLKPDPAAPNAALAERWGVGVIGLSRTAGGYMLDFRFRVVDAEKALPLFDHRIKPYVVAEKSGINLPVPVGNKVGALRPTNRGRNITADRIYYMVFANPDTHLEYGDKVSVVIGDFRVDHLTVH
ncbi:hypothetical protein [uncultured Thiohalocapsa sp.]|uniref:hypothetical protein n=1 Tax=uncultured Thiohalocapsa sp. TaxID=768990 RepID=UPI0025EF194A|nr:hypothetical protein [uncultured Thiohalocapsa sp.]